MPTVNGPSRDPWDDNPPHVRRSQKLCGNFAAPSLTTKPESFSPTSSNAHRAGELELEDFIENYTLELYNGATTMAALAGCHHSPRQSPGSPRRPPIAAQWW